MPEIKRLGITCIDALEYHQTAKAFKKTSDILYSIASNMKNKPLCGFIPWHNYIFSDIDVREEHNFHGSVWTKINRFKKYTEDYNYITLHLIPHVVTTDFNLIIHGDGFAVNPEAWTSEFLEYDYIGATWSSGIVGNGGFSLRSRKLYDALLDIKPPVKAKDYPKEILNDVRYFVIDNTGEYVIPEDNIICKIYRDLLETKYGIKFAPPELADRFSIEHNMDSPWLGKSFGFHGKHGIAEHYGVTV